MVTPVIDYTAQDTGQNYNKRITNMYEIDLWTDGANVTIEKMCANSGLDVTDLLAFDMPCDGSIGRVPEGTGDMHVEFDDLETEDEAGWSAFSGFAPETRAPEPEPSDTDPPFDQNAAIFNVPGLFGTCLKAYGEAYACVAVHGFSTTDLRNAFKNIWGISEEDMLTIDKMMPVARSTGDAFWGGWGRNLNPANFTLPATQSAVKTKFHNTNRYNFGSHALVDWPRIKAIASMIGCRILADDNYVRGRIKRVDFAIDPREVIAAPTDFVFPKITVVDTSPKTALNELYVSNALTYLTNSHATEMGRSRYTRGDTITAELNLDIPRFAIYSLIASGVGKQVDVPLVLKDTEGGGTYDLWVRDKGQAMVEIKRRNQYVDVEQVLKAIAIGNIERGMKGHYRGFVVNQLINTAEGNDPRTQAEAVRELRKVVRSMWGDRILEALMGYGNVIEPGHGGALIGQIIIRSGEKHGIMQEHNLQRLWAKMTDVQNILFFLGRVAARAINSYDRIVEPVFTERYLRLLASSGDFEFVLNNLFSARKRYWVNRYYRTARSSRRADIKRSVINQLMAKVFKHLTFRITQTGDVVTITNASVVAMNESTCAYVRKRNKHYKRDELNFQLDDYSNGSVDAFVNGLVKKRPIMTWVAFSAHFREGYTKFEEDVKNFVWNVVHLSRNSAVEVEEDNESLYDGSEDGDSDFDQSEADEMNADLVVDIPDPAENIYSTDYHHEVVPSVAAEVAPAPKTKAVYVPDLDFGDEDDFIDHTAGRIRLIDELAEDIPGVSLEISLAAVETHGELVLAREYDAILEQVRREHMAANNQVVTGMDIESVI